MRATTLDVMESYIAMKPVIGVNQAPSTRADLFRGLDNLWQNYMVELQNSANRERDRREEA